LLSFRLSPIQVEVFHPGLQRLFAFPCYDWLKVTDAEGLEGCKKKLLEGSIAAAGGWALDCLEYLYGVWCFGVQTWQYSGVSNKKRLRPGCNFSGNTV
jgi:hypothetical protein